MDLLDVIDPNFGLVENHHTGRKFGKDGQLTVLGWSGKYRSAKRYILRCDICAEDPELYGEGYFRAVLPNLSSGKVPCGCTVSNNLTADQLKVIASRACQQLGLTFIGFKSSPVNSKTLCLIECSIHGIYDTTRLGSLTGQGSGCKKCAYVKGAVGLTLSEDVWSEKFISTGMFHEDTIFTRSDVLNNRGYKTSWNFTCPVCNWTGVSEQSNLRAGKIPCDCSYVTKMNEGYINIVSDNGTEIAIKFGISSLTARRVKVQDTKSVYDIRNFGVWKFLDHNKCRESETVLLKTLECGILSKCDMPDGFTETTYLYNLDKIVETFEKYGGVRIE